MTGRKSHFYATRGFAVGIMLCPIILCNLRLKLGERINVSFKSVYDNELTLFPFNTDFRRLTTHVKTGFVYIEAPYNNL